MTDSSDKFDLSGFTLCQLATATHSIMRTVSAVFEERFGISMPEWKVLAVVSEKPGLSAVAVARFAQMDTVAVSRAVTKLMDRGRVVRELDSEDRRRSILNLSEQGSALYNEIAPVAKQLEANLFDEFSDDEKHVIDKIVRQMSAKAGAFSEDYVTAAQPAPQPVFTANNRKRENNYRPQRPAPLLSRMLNGGTYSVR